MGRDERRALHGEYSFVRCTDIRTLDNREGWEKIERREPGTSLGEVPQKLRKGNVGFEFGVDTHVLHLTFTGLQFAEKAASKETPTSYIPKTLGDGRLTAPSLPPPLHVPPPGTDNLPSLYLHRDTPARRASNHTLLPCAVSATRRTC